MPASTATKKLRLVIVGEGPGRVEVNRGEPFIGPSGLLLKRLLKEGGFINPMGDVDWESAHVTNATLCRPETEKELEAARLCCGPRLAAELAALDARIPILALGSVATKSLLGKANILKMRGFVWDVATPTGAKKKKERKHGKEGKEKGQRGGDQEASKGVPRRA